ncbi:MAG: N-acetyltransferase [Acidobacteria bacterium]|nr:N-acetyltransferase [Acidobacteriota bacterium]
MGTTTRPGGRVANAGVRERRPGLKSCADSQCRPLSGASRVPRLGCGPVQPGLAILGGVPSIAVRLRRAAVGDLERINAIYNHFVLTSTCTYQEDPDTIDARRAWLEQHGPQYPVIVALADDLVVGWGSLSRFHARSAYRYTVENSVYVDHEWQRQGIGSSILRDLISRARLIGYQTIVAEIDAEQTASLALHARHGFEPAGRLQVVGYKFGRWLDVVYLQKRL